MFDEIDEEKQRNEHEDDIDAKVSSLPLLEGTSQYFIKILTTSCLHVHVKVGDESTFVKNSPLSTQICDLVKTCYENENSANHIYDDEKEEKTCVTRCSGTGRKAGPSLASRKVDLICVAISKWYLNKKFQLQRGVQIVFYVHWSTETW